MFFFHILRVLERWTVEKGNFEVSRKHETNFEATFYPRLTLSMDTIETKLG